MSYQERIQAEVDAHNELAEELQQVQERGNTLQQELITRRGRISILQELAQEEANQAIEDAEDPDE
jgi:hypothetical protein